jgi:hypothetical protein
MECELRAGDPIKRPTIRTQICELWEKWPKREKLGNNARNMLRFYFTLTDGHPTLASNLPASDLDRNWDIVVDWLTLHEGRLGRGVQAASRLRIDVGSE